MTPTARENKPDAALSGDALHEPLDSLSIELARISAEIQSINSGFQAQMLQALAETRAAIENQHRAKFEKAMEEIRQEVRLEVQTEMRKDFEEELRQRIGHLDTVRAEIERVAGQLEGVAREIAAMLDDPSVELSRVMRKRTEQAELKSYLTGLRFSIGEQPKAKAAGASESGS